MGIILIIKLALLSLSGGRTHQRRGQPDGSPSEGSPSSGVCLTACRLADGLPVGRFALPSPSGRNPSGGACENSWFPSRKNSNSGMCLTARRIADGVPIGKFALLLLSRKYASNRATIIVVLRVEKIPAAECA